MEYTNAIIEGFIQESIYLLLFGKTKRRQKSAYIHIGAYILGLDIGPNLNPDFLAVLLWFHAYDIAWIADIEMAFLQIELEGEDSEAVWFLRVRDPADSKSPTVDYSWKRLPFGLTSSPFVLKAVILKHVDSFKDQFRDTLQLIKDQLYVDDLRLAKRTIEEIKAIFQAAGMKMRKWSTNNKDIQSHVNRPHVTDVLKG